MAGTAVANVAVGKPNLKLSGGMLVGPLGTPRPEGFEDPIDPAYVSCGYVGEDGVSEASERSTEVIKAWGGIKVRTVQTEFGTTLTVTVIESRNADTLKLVFGEDNVTVTPGAAGQAAVIKVRRNEKTLPHTQIVFDMLDGDSARRLDVGNAQVTGVGDISYVDGEAISYELTISADPDENGDTLVEYIAGEITPAGE